MVTSGEHGAAAPGARPDPLQGVLAAFVDRRRPQRVLLVSGQPSAPPRFDPAPETRVFRIQTRDGSGQAPAVVCDTAELPFQSRVFDLVLAHHVLTDGREPELLEFERVLEGGGHLLVLGQGFWCGRQRLSRGSAVAAPVRPWRLCSALRGRDFTIEICMGQGVAGFGLATGSGWKVPLVGVSDEVMILARAAGSRHVVTPLRYGQPRAVGARAAALDGLNREAAS